jgi:tRNA(Arg) A34 adenosine deaminase TadA
MPITDEQHAQFMKRAIELSRASGVVEKTGGCFGAVIVDASTGEVVEEGRNRVLSENDPTWHGEVEAIRRACKKVGSPHLNGCVIYTSAQPCPMCHCACLWARLEKIYFGATYEDVMEYGKFEDADFMGELTKPAAEQGTPCVPLLRDEAVEVWKEYGQLVAAGEVRHY